MGDRKSRSVTFKVAFQINVGLLKSGIERVTSEEITVFQNIGNDEFLVELKSKNAAEALIEEGFDVEELHICCHPPHGYYTNVSIMGLRSYVEDNEVIEALTPYGEIKSEIFRLKYKQDHELAGIENGNRFVKMILASRSIPYSMKIGGQWCRIIYNDQQPVCSECRQEGHTRRRCPVIECRRCKNKGHMSYDCDKAESNEPEEIKELVHLFLAICLTMATKQNQMNQKIKELVDLFLTRLTRKWKLIKGMKRNMYKREKNIWFMKTAYKVKRGLFPRIQSQM